MEYHTQSKALESILYETHVIMETVFRAETELWRPIMENTGLHPEDRRPVGNHNQRHDILPTMLFCQCFMLR